MKSSPLSISVTFSQLKLLKFLQLHPSLSFLSSLTILRLNLPSFSFFKPKYGSPFLLLAELIFLSQSLGFISSSFLRFLFATSPTKHTTWPGLFSTTAWSSTSILGAGTYPWNTTTSLTITLGFLTSLELFTWLWLCSIIYEVLVRNILFAKLFIF